MNNLTFNYALRSPCGKYYTGNAGDTWLGPKHQAFTYTIAGAERKLTLPAFAGFIVERV